MELYGSQEEDLSGCDADATLVRSINWLFGLVFQCQAALNSHPYSWWWSLRPCRRRAPPGQSGRWPSDQGWWTRAWRGRSLQRTAPGYESWPHHRQWWSACRCRWCSVWRHEERERTGVREGSIAGGISSERVRMTQSAVTSTADCVGDEMTSKAKHCVRPRAKRLTVCQHSHVFIAPEMLVSPHQRLLNMQLARKLKYL